MTRLTEHAKQNYLRLLRGEKPVLGSMQFTPARGPKIPAKRGN